MVAILTNYRLLGEKKFLNELKKKVGKKKSPSDISSGLYWTRYLDLLLKHFQQ